MQPLQPFKGSVANFCWVLRAADSLSFLSVCSGRHAFYSSATQAWPRPRPTSLKWAIMAVPCHAPSPAAGPWLKPMTSKFPNCQKPSQSERVKRMNQKTENVLWKNKQTMKWCGTHWLSICVTICVAKTSASGPCFPIGVSFHFYGCGTKAFHKSWLTVKISQVVLKQTKLFTDALMEFMIHKAAMLEK